MPSAALGAFMADVLRRFVLDLDRFGCERRKPLADLLGNCQTE
ncbi:MAG: hypothetical protein ACXW2T_11155 [Allosphingosinicella sp.]